MDDIKVPNSLPSEKKNWGLAFYRIPWERFSCRLDIDSMSSCRLLIMRPHADDFNRFFLIQNLINKAMLYINAPGIGSRQVSQELFKRWGCLIWIFAQNIQQLFSLGFQTGCRYFLSVFWGLFRENESPHYQSSLSEHSSIGVANPSRIDSRMSGIFSR